jgi:hypothetical protein
LNLGIEKFQFFLPVYKPKEQESHPYFSFCVAGSVVSLLSLEPGALPDISTQKSIWETKAEESLVQGRPCLNNIKKEKYLFNE